MDDIIEQIRGGVTDDEPCPYLAGKSWKNLILDVGPVFSPAIHEYFLDNGFRRMGRFIYRPMCDGCAECRPLRVDVEEFRPSRAQRRALAKNGDVTVEFVEAEYTEEKRELLERYLAARHTGPMVAEEESMREYMYDTPGHTVCMDYRLDGRLVGSGLVDLLPRIVSSIYFFFDPELERRSLGIYSMLKEIECARDRGARWFHPGFYIRDLSAMRYKAEFRPAEIFTTLNVWQPLRGSAPDAGHSRRFEA